MMEESQIIKLRANQRFLVWELQRRGIEVRMLDRMFEVFEAIYEGHREILMDIDSSLMPYPAAMVSGNKFLTKSVLRQLGITVPEGRLFHSEDVPQAVPYAYELGYPVVVKPNLGVSGEQVHVNLEHPQEVERAIEALLEAKGDVGFVIEKHFDGEEYRVFITRDGDYAIVQREPAFVIGNGRDNLLELARVESERRMNPRRNALGTIVMDEIAETFLRKVGLSFEHVPISGEKVYVRPNSNVGTGGMCTDYTEAVHPSVIAICHDVLMAFPGMPYAGIDFMTTDVTREQTPESYRIIEVNSLPGIGIHMAPGAGAPRNVAGMLVDMIFPETRTHR